MHIIQTDYIYFGKFLWRFIMFWGRFVELCEYEKGKPTAIANSIGISSATVTKWKNGAIPNGDTLIKIAEHFKVSTDYLLGLSDHKAKTIPLDKLDTFVPEYEGQPLYAKIALDMSDEDLLIFEDFLKKGGYDYKITRLDNTDKNNSKPQDTLDRKDKFLKTFCLLNEDNQDIIMGKMKELLKEQRYEETVAAGNLKEAK